jgi:hypothetical protein
MRFSLPLLGMSVQIPLETSPPASDAITPAMARRLNPGFKLKEGANVLSPKEMLELPRPAAAMVNTAGDLFLVPVSKYSFEEKKCVRPPITPIRWEE